MQRRSVLLVIGVASLVGLTGDSGRTWEKICFSLNSALRRPLAMNDGLGLPGSLGEVLNFLLLCVPGTIAVSIYDVRVPGERRKFGEMSIALVTYSALIDIAALIFLTFHPISLCSPLFPAGGSHPVPCDPWPPIVFALFFVVILPAAVGWFSFDARRWLSRIVLALSPVPMAWDELFSRLAEKKEPVAIVLTLKDGSKVGGVWDKDAFVSTYPADGDLLIAVPCTLDPQTGQIAQRIAGSQGLLVKRDDILAL